MLLFFHLSCSTVFNLYPGMQVSPPVPSGDRRRKGPLPQVHQDEGVLPQVRCAEQVYKRGAQLFSDILFERQHLGRSQGVSCTQAAVSRKRHQGPLSRPPPRDRSSHGCPPHPSPQMSPVPSCLPRQPHRHALSDKCNPKLNDGRNPLLGCHLEVGRRQFPILLGYVVHYLYCLSVSLL